MIGIVINDSILKMHAVNMKLKEGKDINTALKLATISRRNSIIMTSLTTILAMCPVFLFNSFGNDIQKPLALSVIGGLSLGTFLSIYLIPILFKIFHNMSRLIS